MDTAILMQHVAWGCGQTVIALLLMIVGGVSVRPVEARSGYLLVLAGALVFFKGCCGSLPTIVAQTGHGYGALDLLYTIDSWVGLLFHIGAGGASVVAAVLLARAVLSHPQAAAR